MEEDCKPANMDVNNLKSALQMFYQVVNVFIRFIRPKGNTVYWIIVGLFGLLLFVNK